MPRDNDYLMYNGTKSYKLTENGWLSMTSDDNSVALSAYEAYKRVPWVRGAVDKLAQTAASVPIDIVVRGTVLENPEEADFRLGIGWPGLIRAAVIDLAVYGSAYCYLQPNVAGRNPQPVRWSPAGVTTTFDTSGNAQIRRINTQGIIDPASVIDWWTGDPAVEVGGAVPLIMPALAAAETLRNLDSFTSRYFKGGAVKATLLKVAGSASQEEMDRLTSWWNNLMRGVSRAWKAIAIRSNIEPVVIGGDIKDTSAPDLVMKAREDVAVAIGIPQTLLMSNAANYATANVDLAIFLTQHVIPLVENMTARVNRHPAYMSAGVRLVVHGERLEALQAWELEKASKLRELTGGQAIITTEEARKQLGYEIEEQETVEPDADEEPPAMNAEELRSVRKRALTQHRLGLPIRVDPRFDGELAQCKSASDIRDVFERYWPREAE